MNISSLIRGCAIVATCGLATTYTTVSVADATPGFNNEIPEKILTPDKVETRLGTFEFVDGVPTVETTQKLYDNLDHMRGVEVFLNFIPASFTGSDCGWAPSRPARARSTRRSSSMI